MTHDDRDEDRAGTLGSTESATALTTAPGSIKNFYVEVHPSGVGTRPPLETMNSVLTILLVFVVVSTACSSSNSSTTTATASHPVVRIEFLTWVEESPGMAQSLATSDVIAKAKFVSLDVTVKSHDSWGHVAELVYTFEAVRYLKGNGDDELVVRMSSGPKYIAFPDWLDNRTQSEAIELADNWLSRSIDIFDNRQNGILLLRRSGQGEDYRFTSSEEGHGYGGSPTLGVTWLAEDQASTYRHQFQGAKSTTISLSDLSARIEDMRPLTEGEYAPCVAKALYYRSLVRGQLLGTHRELTLGGYGEPDPFPRFAAAIDSESSENATVFGFQRPPYQAPRFSDYWLDGRDKDLFALDTGADPRYTYEGLRTVRALPQGEYIVLYSQFHHSLPCDGPFGFFEEAWESTDTTEWVVNVTPPDG